MQLVKHKSWSCVGNTQPRALASVLTPGVKWHRDGSRRYTRGRGEGWGGEGFETRVLPAQPTKGSGASWAIPHWGPEQSPGRKRISVHSKHHRMPLVEVFVVNWNRQNRFVNRKNSIWLSRGGDSPTRPWIRLWMSLKWSSLVKSSPYYSEFTHIPTQFHEFLISGVFAWTGRPGQKVKQQLLSTADAQVFTPYSTGLSEFGAKKWKFCTL